MIDYKSKITTHREFYPMKDLDTSVESDRGRVLSSSAFRRLQKRTQVFALELNASIRTRLTHSLEVAQSARFIAKSIISKLKKDSTLSLYGLDGLENAFVSTSEMTSLLHDIGNPPFGHFAEQSINKWMHENVIEMFDEFDLNLKEDIELKEQLKKDVCNYDGNAQAIRIITKLQRLNLSYTQILSVLKYTRGAHESVPKKSDDFGYLRKKPGFYYSEKDIVTKLQNTLHVNKWHRFPITYIMEAADDINYLVADLEDSVEKGILSLDMVYELIKTECEKLDERYLLDIIEDKYEKIQKNDEPYRFNMFFTLFKAQFIRELVDHVSNVYIKNHQEIFDGSFNSSLLDYKDKDGMKYYGAIKILQNISYKHIYQNKDVQELELQGYSIINGLLDVYKPLISLSADDFLKLMRDEKIECFVSMRLVKRLSEKQLVAYKQDIKNLDFKNQKDLMLEKYYRIRLIIDYISGMTDDFALNEFNVLLAR